MKQTPLNLNIPEPCSENWDEMTPTAPNERYCGKCSKNLIDFTSFSDAEVHRQLASNNGRICGRFRPDQLGRDIHATQPRASKWKHWAAAAAVIASGGLAGQEAPPTPEPAPVEFDAGIINGRVHVVQDIAVPKTITGRVTTPDGEPVIGATVMCLVDEEFINGTVTDLEGKFTLPYTSGGRLKLQYVGAVTQFIDYAKLPTNELGEVEVAAVLKFDAVTLEQIVVTANKPAIMGEIVSMVGYVVHEDVNPAPPAMPPATYLQTANVSPNPFTDRLLVKLQSEQEHQLTARLFTADGRLAQEWSPRPVYTHTTELQLLLARHNRLASGQYFLVLQDETGRMETRVVVRK